jgi:hypothetical protein
MSITLERQKLPLTLNVGRQKGEWSRRKELADWREWAAKEADGLPGIIGAVSITVTHLRKNWAAMPRPGGSMTSPRRGLTSSHGTSTSDGNWWERSACRRPTPKPSRRPPTNTAS